MEVVAARSFHLTLMMTSPLIVNDHPYPSSYEYPTIERNANITCFCWMYIYIYNIIVSPEELEAHLNAYGIIKEVKNMKVRVASSIYIYFLGFFLYRNLI